MEHERTEKKENEIGREEEKQEGREKGELLVEVMIS